MNEQTQQSKAFEPVDLGPELQRQKRIEDMQLMRRLDIVPRHEVKNILVELNLRMAQYIDTFGSFSLDFLILQTVQDFKPHYVVLQAKKLDKTKPVLMLRDNQRPIFINPAIVRADYKQGGVNMFIDPREDEPF